MEVTKKSIEVAGILRRLLRQKYFLRQKNEKWFQVLMDHRQEIDSILMGFLAKLHLNESNGIAFLGCLNEEIEEQLDFPLGRRIQLSTFATMILLFLRKERLEYYQNPEGRGEICIVKLEDIRQFLEGFQSFKSDRQFEMTFRKALDELSDLQVIYELSNEQPFYEITAVCDVLLPIDEMIHLKQKIENYFQTSEVQASV